MWSSIKYILGSLILVAVGVIFAFVLLEITLRLYSSFTSSKEPHWLLVDLGEERMINHLRAKPRHDAPKTFWKKATLKGSVSGSSFEFITSLNLESPPASTNWISWDFSNNRQYRYYKLSIFSGFDEGQFYSFAELELDGPDKRPFATGYPRYAASSYLNEFPPDCLFDDKEESFWHVYDPKIAKKFESYFRTMKISRNRANKISRFFLYDPLLGWKGAPGVKGIQESYFGSGPFYIEHNSGGLRDREVSYQKKPGVWRVLVLADSLGWGIGVNHEELFSEILENALKPSVEVINASVPAYGTDQELLFLKTEGLKYDPDLVLLIFCSNDPINNLQEVGLLPGLVPKPRFELNDGKLRLINWSSFNFFMARSKRLIMGLRFWPLDHSEVFNTLLRTKKILTAPKPKAGSQDWKLTEALLLEIIKTLQEHKIRFAIVITDTKERTHQWAKDFCHTHSIDLVDAIEQFQENKQKLYFKQHDHWTAEGHILMAQILQKYITQSRVNN